MRPPGRGRPKAYWLGNLPVAVLALVLRLIGESRVRPDALGAVLGTGAALSFVYGLLRAGESSRGETAVVGPLFLARVLTVAFLVVERRTAEPLVPLSFLSFRTRVVVNGAGRRSSAACYAMAFMVMIQLQTVLGCGSITAGLVYLPYCAGMLVGMWGSSGAVIRLGARRTLVVSFVVSAAGLLLPSGIAPGDAYASGVLPGMLVMSVGCGLSLPALTVTALTATTEEDARLGSAVVTSVQQVCGAVGLAVLVTRCRDTLVNWTGPLHAATQGFSLALVVGTALLLAGVALIATMLTALTRRPRPPLPPPAPAPRKKRG
ncbi:hypothetical protein SSPIM334S_04014 [Streptomyces spiroverticillatus]|uniref:hypothetical protein n=1 Tax=Streptomyces finlayi TaxID=67296 RepID=UPI001673C222|nr:hypothetical protein [Streptomyces finlayi]